MGVFPRPGGAGDSSPQGVLPVGLSATQEIAAQATGVPQRQRPAALPRQTNHRSFPGPASVRNRSPAVSWPFAQAANPESAHNPEKPGAIKPAPLAPSGPPADRRRRRYFFYSTRRGFIRGGKTATGWPGAIGKRRLGWRGPGENNGGISKAGRWAPHDREIMRSIPRPSRRQNQPKA